MWSLLLVIYSICIKHYSKNLWLVPRNSALHFIFMFETLCMKTKWFNFQPIEVKWSLWNWIHTVVAHFIENGLFIRWWIVCIKYTSVDVYTWRYSNILVHVFASTFQEEMLPDDSAKDAPKEYGSVLRTCHVLSWLLAMFCQIY